VTASDQLNQDRVEVLIRGNSCIKEKGIAVTLGISKKSEGHIIGVLGFRKVRARWVQLLLSYEMKSEKSSHFSGNPGTF